MKLDEALQQQTNFSLTESQEDIYHMIGGLGMDFDPNVFRFYPDTANTRSYLLINKADVVGEVYRLTDLEKAHKGFVDIDTFRIAVRHGTKVRSVSVSLESIGKTISAEMSPGSRAARSGCQYTSGCGSLCCTDKGDGNCYCDTCCIA